MLADSAIADALAEQVALDPGRAWILERHLERAEPRARYLLDTIRSTGDRLLDTLAELVSDEPEAAAPPSPGKAAA